VTRPLAASYLSRIAQMTGPCSLARAVAEGRLEIRSLGPEDEQVLAPLRTLAKDEKVIEEEAQALGRAKGWPVMTNVFYGWTRLRGEIAREALPRIVRIYDREIFELSSDARVEPEDEEVRSLVLATLEGRRAVNRALANLLPAVTLPGAK
jgi:hypothetical protein